MIVITLNLSMSHCLYYTDLQHQFLEPKAENAFLTIVEGACSNRPRDEALTLGPSSNPGTRVDFNQIDNRLSGPSCIGLIANTDANDVEPVAIFYDSNLTEIGRIVLTRSSINVTVRSSFASFGFPEQSTQDHSRLQLCMDGVKMELYHDCLLVGSEPFVSGGFQESDVIGLLRHLVTENAPPYLVSCIESLGNHLNICTHFCLSIHVAPPPPLPFPLFTEQCGTVLFD